LEIFFSKVVSYVSPSLQEIPFSSVTQSFSTS
jgi:hypothetical protein